VFQNEAAAKKSLPNRDATVEAAGGSFETVSAKDRLKDRVVLLSRKHPYDGRRSLFIELLEKEFGKRYTDGQVKPLISHFTRRLLENLDTEGFQFSPDYYPKPGPKS
jgi:hypothetical protein